MDGHVVAFAAPSYPATHLPLMRLFLSPSALLLIAAAGFLGPTETPTGASQSLPFGPFGRRAVVLMSSGLAAAAGEIVWIAADPAARGSVALDAQGLIYSLSGDSILRCLDRSGIEHWAFTNTGGPFLDTVSVLASGSIAAASANAVPQEGPFNALYILGPQGVPEAVVEGLNGSVLPAVGPDDSLTYLTWSNTWTRRRADGSIAWETTEPWDWSTTPSAWADGTIFLPGSFLLDHDGTAIWRARRLGVTSSAALGADGTAYFGGEWNGVAGLRAVGPNGAVRWNVALSAGVTSPPSLFPDGSLLFGTPEGEIIRCDATGTILWRFAASAPVSSSPAIGADLLAWVGTDDGRLLALTPEGVARWSLNLGNRIASSPAIDAGGRVYVAVEGAGVVAVQGAAGPADSPWPMYRHDAARTGRGIPRATVPGPTRNVQAAESTERGTVTVRWNAVPLAESYDILRGTTAEVDSMTAAAVALTTEDTFADRFAPPDVTFHYRVRARSRAGDGPWSDAASASQSFRRWTFSALSDLRGAPAMASDGSLRIVTSPGGASQALIAIDADGLERWRFTDFAMFGVASPPAIGFGDVTYFTGAGTELVAVAPNGNLQWRWTFPPTSGQHIAPDGELAIASDGRVLLCIEGGPMIAIDPNGTEAWRANLRCNIDSTPVVAADGAIAVAPKVGLTAVFEPNGMPRFEMPMPRQPRLAATAAGDWFGFGDGRLWRTDATGRTNLLLDVGPRAGNPGSVVVDPQGAMYVVSRQFALVAFDPDGQRRWAVTNRAFSGGPVILSDGMLLARLGPGVAAYRAEDGQLQWSTVGGGPDPFVGPPQSLVVTPDGRLLLAAGPSLVAFGPVAPPAGAGWPMDRFDVARTGRVQETAARLKSLRPAATGWELAFHAPKESRWVVETSGDLVGWTGAGEVTAAAGETRHLLDLPAASPHHFLRLRQAPP